MSTDARARAWVDVSWESLRQNFSTIREAVGQEVRMIPMVKADAYGLGLAETVRALEPLDPWGWGVAEVEEGVDLRQAGVAKPILVCSPTPPGSYARAVEAELTVSVSSLQGLSDLHTTCRELGARGRFHVEVDTGMGRAGFDWRRVAAWGPAVAGFHGADFVWEGVFTHFHSADGADPGPTLQQWERLWTTLEKIPSRPTPLMVHACNSPGALRRPDFGADAVRPGIFLYGGVAGEALPPPRVVASLRSRIVHIKEAEAGSTVGYGFTYAAEGNELWATVGIGYGDGLPRLLSNRGEALLRGRRVPIIGRISMDVTVLNVTNLPDVALGEVATFFGRAGGAEIGLEEVARHAGTINYEILTGLTKRLPRIWTNDGGY
jgi:alanine racemase